MESYAQVRPVTTALADSTDGAGLWILRVKIDREWEEGAFPSRMEAEASLKGLLEDYGSRLERAELISPSGEMEELAI